MYLKANPALESVAPHCRSWRGPSSRVRLGIITAFQESHIVAHLFRGLIDHVDRDRFEVFALRSPYARCVASGQGADRVVELPRHLVHARDLRSDYQARMAQRLPAVYEDRNGLRELETFFLAAVRARCDGGRLLEDCIQPQSLPAPN